MIQKKFTKDSLTKYDMGFDRENIVTFYSGDIGSKDETLIDRLLPIAKGEVKGLDNCIINGDKILTEVGIKSQRQSFYDDITIGTFGGKNNERT